MRLNEKIKKRVFFVAFLILVLFLILFLSIIPLKNKTTGNVAFSAHYRFYEGEPKKVQFKNVLYTFNLEEIIDSNTAIVSIGNSNITLVKNSPTFFGNLVIKAKKINSFEGFLKKPFVDIIFTELEQVPEDFYLENIEKINFYPDGLVKQVYKFGDSFKFYIKFNNVFLSSRYQLKEVHLLSNSELIESISFSCTYYGLCSGKAKNIFFKDGFNNYTLLLNFDFGGSTKYFYSDNYSYNFYIPPIDSNLCQPLIPSFNDPDSERLNLIFIGMGYNDSVNLRDNCVFPLNSYCIRNTSFPFATYINNTNTHITFFCSKRNYSDINRGIFTIIDGINITLRLDDLEAYDIINETTRFGCSEIKPFEENLKETSRMLLGLEKEEGFFDIEPFKSNTDKFNLWYINYPIGLDYCKEYEEDTIGTYTNCLIYPYLSLSCNFENNYSIYLINKELPGIGGFAPFGQMYLDAPIPKIKSSFLYQSIQRSFIHEAGHFFGLFDEYVSMPNKEFPFKNLTNSLNCYVGIERTYEECLQNAQWKNLIGNGCGEEGIIDCTPEDENYDLEIGCFEGCRQFGKGIFRPTQNSIMRGGNDKNVFSFGLWNENLIENELSKYF